MPREKDDERYHIDESHRDQCLSCSKPECTNCFKSAANAASIVRRRQREAAAGVRTWKSWGFREQGDSTETVNVRVKLVPKGKNRTLTIQDDERGISYTVPLIMIEKYMKGEKAD